MQRNFMADKTGNDLSAPAYPVPITKHIWFWYRASGECVCEICGREFWRHKHEMEEVDWNDDPYLKIICNGDRVKL